MITLQLLIGLVAADLRWRLATRHTDWDLIAWAQKLGVEGRADRRARAAARPA